MRVYTVTILFQQLYAGMICMQDQQLCLLLKLQVLSALSRIHADVLPFRRLHFDAVLRQVLAGKMLNSVIFYYRVPTGCYTVRYDIEIALKN